MCISHVTFQIYLSFQKDDIDINPTIARTFALFDLIQIKAASCGAFHILPDVVMCIVSIVGTSFTCSKYKRQQNYDDDTIDVLGNIDDDDRSSNKKNQERSDSGCCGLCTAKMQQN